MLMITWKNSDNFVSEFSWNAIWTSYWVSTLRYIGVIVWFTRSNWSVLYLDLFNNKKKVDFTSFDWNFVAGFITDNGSTIDVGRELTGPWSQPLIDKRAPCFSFKTSAT